MAEINQKYPVPLSSVKIPTRVLLKNIFIFKAIMVLICIVFFFVLKQPE